MGKYELSLEENIIKRWCFAVLKFFLISERGKTANA
jgi:hypothetical protein